MRPLKWLVFPWLAISKFCEDKFAAAAPVTVSNERAVLVKVGIESSVKHNRYVVSPAYIDRSAQKVKSWMPRS